MEKLKMHSTDLTQGNIAKLAELFPNCVTESKAEDGSLKRSIDFDLLRQELSGSIVEGPQERYHINWPGKREAILAANAPTAKCLRPLAEESVEFESTKNLLIQGENLDVLKLLQETYLDQIALIYIDPPYNTASDLIYEDDFALDSSSYFSKSMQVDSTGGRLVANQESKGRFHSDWLTMLYSRLKLSRNLLAPNGCLVMHIDENELANAKKVLDEIFGYENCLGEIVWDKKNPKGDSSRIAVQHETLLCYCKDAESFRTTRVFQRAKSNAEAMIRQATKLFRKCGTRAVPEDILEVDKKYGLNLNLEDLKRTISLQDVNSEFRTWLSKQDVSGGEAAYKYIDAQGEVYRTVSMAWPNKKRAPQDYFIPLIHPVTKKPCPVPERGWRNPPDTMKKLLETGQVLFGKDETKQPERKYLLRDNLSENIPSVLGFGGSDDDLMKSLGIVFDNPKPVALATSLIRWFCTEPDDIVLDFFAGSGTTAHATMEANSIDNKHRRFILVQLEESCEHNLAALDSGFQTIADITKARIRSAGKTFDDRLPLLGNDFDVGFRVLKLDYSNLKDVYYAPDGFKQGDLLDQIDNIKEDRTSEDLLFQVLLDWGVDLSLPIEQKSFAGKKVFFVDGNALAACFDRDVTDDLVKSIAAKMPLRAVFRDAGYSSDSSKINVEQIFKLLSPTTELRCI